MLRRCRARVGSPGWRPQSGSVLFAGDIQQPSYKVWGVRMQRLISHPCGWQLPKGPLKLGPLIWATRLLSTQRPSAFQPSRHPSLAPLCASRPPGRQTQRAPSCKARQGCGLRSRWQPLKCFFGVHRGEWCLGGLTRT